MPAATPARRPANTSSGTDAPSHDVAAACDAEREINGTFQTEVPEREGEDPS